ncbi:MAG: ABC transporter permease subunit [Chloroflexi bacterium]|nr:ABC transporter permease subunit [Chloroflexota bacterium]
MPEQVTSQFDLAAHAPIPFWRDLRVIQIFIQLVFLVGIIALGYVLINNLLTNLDESGLTIDYGKLEEPVGTELSEGENPFSSEAQENGQDKPQSGIDALVQGFKNTLRVVIVGLVGATILGVLVGIGQLGNNFLIRSVANVYVEIFRNTPLLVQLFFIYFGMWFNAVPDVQNSIELPGPIYIHVRGINYPLVQRTDSAWILLLGLGLGIIIGGALWVWRLRRMDRTGNPAHTLRWSLPALLICATLGWLASGKPFSVELPHLEGFNYVDGSRVTPEYIAITLGLILYTAAFIADVVRAGIQAVSHGQIEAARAQGLTNGQTLRLVVLPQALRLIIPPLGNQYLNLAKNSSLGAAVAFLDVYRTASLVSSQIDQPIVMFSVMMIIYLTISLTISLIMNLVNFQMRLRSR